MNNKLTITFLSDSPNGWMSKYIHRLVNKLKNRCNIKICYIDKEVQEGDILFILSFYKLVPEEILKRNKSNIVVHASNLPKGKGWSPATWQILEGKDKIPLSLFEAVKQVDAGPIYFQDNLELNGTELIKEWQEKMGKKISEMILKYINSFPMKGKEQIGQDSYYPRRTPENSELDINKSIKDQFNLLRVVDNEKYPTFFKYKGKKFILKIYSEKANNLKIK